MVKRIETRESQTAEMTCLTRTLSFYEKNELLKSDDYIAPKIVPPAKLRLVKMLRPLVMKMVAYAGHQGRYP
ncbi:MAG TPA: hypothetical protein VKM55_10405 [Candidatus Lokiarchaeia archaeon]|nr:hypothetical protein [Candidatus Lokiarchaeia archaeon]